MADWAPKKVKYITNRDLLGEIQRSKATFCHFTASEYANYDAIVTNTEDLTPEFLAATLLTKLARLGKLQIASDGITSADVVFRVMSDQHLPEETDEKRRRKSSSGGWIPRTNFPPFQHFVLHNDLLIEVGRSHWKGGMENGNFSVTHGKITERLASMFLLLVEQYSRRGNWRGYCLSEDHEALTQRGWLGIDEINENDIILSYEDGKLKWSKIKSIYRDEFDGEMFSLIGRGIDAFVTPGHRFITQDGLIPVEYLREGDKIILSPDDSIAFEAINQQMVNYQGRIWCPETEYGCFMTRRNGQTFLVGNSYLADMRGQALVQLSQVGLQFDESRSDNPFAWYTQIVKNSFRRSLLLEKRNQDIRDDLLVMHGAMPSYTRQVDDDLEQKALLADTGTSDSEAPAKKEAKKRGRKPKPRNRE